MTEKSERSGQRGGRDPWSVPVPLGQIPATGLHKVITPSVAEAAALAEAAGLLHAHDIRAEFDLTPVRGDRIKVVGRVTGQVGQTCVVTLDPIESKVDEQIELLFAPPEQVQEIAALNEKTDDDEDRPDPPEAIENGMIDLGRVASDALFLGLDPYPRKPDAVFEPPAEISDPADHPFAALKALKPDA